MEQGFTKICLTELAMGKKVESAPNKEWKELQTQLESTANDYSNIPRIESLRSIAANVNIL